MMLNKKEDSMSAILQITAGAGGTESCDWAEMLLRMYLMWGEKNNFKIKELNNQSGDVAGIKTATIQIDGDFAFGWLKGEKMVCIVWLEFLLLIVMQNDIHLLHLYMSIHLLMIQLK